MKFLERPTCNEVLPEFFCCDGVYCHVSLGLFVLVLVNTMRREAVPIPCISTDWPHKALPALNNHNHGQGI